MQYKMPVLLLIWNRPGPTERVFNSIKRIKPERLFLAADGPRIGNPLDEVRCKKTREVVSRIDWKCKVKKLYRDNNLGLKLSVSEAITWFFNNVNEGVILEDDCLPNKSFFVFCSKMLKLYKTDEKVMHISGNNFQPKDERNKNSYYFTKYAHIWGWATWKRAWKHYDLKMRNWPEFKKRMLKKIHKDYWTRLYWTVILDSVYKGKINTWDYQWLFAVWNNNGIAINPGVNLVSNIGFGSDAVHTKSASSKLNNLKVTNLANSLGRQSKVVNKRFDKHTSKNVFGINPLSVISRLLYYNFKYAGERVYE